MVKRVMPANWYQIRWAVLERDGFACQYCGQFAPVVRLEVDHVVAFADGGTDELSNLVTACYACNRGKEAYRASLYRSTRARADRLIGLHRPSLAAKVREMLIEDGDLSFIRVMELGMTRKVAYATLWRERHRLREKRED